MICIDVSSDTIQIVVAKKTRRKVEILSCKKLMLPNSLFKGDGEINFNVLEECIADTLGSIADKKVVITFSFSTTVYSLLRMYKEKNNRQQRMAIESQVFANISADDYYVDYYLQNATPDKDGLCDFVTYAAKKTLVDGSKELLRKLGKTPVAFLPSQYAAYLFIKHYFNEKTITLAKISQKDITLHLFNPPYNIITRSILLEQANTNTLSGVQDDTRTILQQNLEKLNSYQSIKFPGKSMEGIVLFGDSNVESAVKFIQDTIDIPCEKLSDIVGDLSTCEAVYPIGSLLCESVGKINFFDADIYTRAIGRQRTINLPVAAASLLVIANIALIIVTMIIESEINNDVEQKTQLLNEPEIIRQLNSYGVLREELVSKYKSESDFVAVEAELESMSDFNQDTYYTFINEAPDGVVVVNVSYTSGVYNISCVGQNEQQAADYVKAITELNLFKDVAYFGFSDNGTDVLFTMTGGGSR